MFGKLTLNAFKHDAIIQGANILTIVVMLAVIALITYHKKWKWLWTEYLTSLDPKKIGVMYMVVALVMLFKGVSDAALMRAQQAFSVGSSHGYLTPSHFQQIFTAHGTTMIFFVGMAFVFGMMNLAMPLQLGARDVAFPFLNSVGFWLFVAGSSFIMISLLIGDFSAAGWLPYPPLSGLKYNPGEGVDYWIWSVQIAGIGSLVSGINFIVTIFKMRCPGMTLMKMPIFVWSSLGCLVLVIFAFPILTATIGMLTLDRYLGMHFFTAGAGGSPMMFINLIWAWGHPEVYILVLPAFGIYSEVVATFSHKYLFGYASMVWAIIAITFLSFIVWLHHFFTMGASPYINAFFGIMTMVIAVPTGVKIFNWLLTMFRGKVVFSTPLLWFMGFIVTFSTGGVTGVLMSMAPVDFQVHNSLFLIAHFHSMVIGGVLFAFFSGFAYWFPKIMGFKLNEKIGKIAFWFWIIGFLLAFMPLYLLGLMGATRRLDHYDASLGWQPLFIVVALGVASIVIGVGFQIYQLYVSIRDRKYNRDTTGDPWNGRTLEWSTKSPPPHYNFAVLPEVDCRDPFWVMKQKKQVKSKPHYEDIHMPKNTGVGVYIGALSIVVGFALVWHIMWLALVGMLGIAACLIVHLSNDDIEYVITAKELQKMEEGR